MCNRKWLEQAVRIKTLRKIRMLNTFFLVAWWKGDSVVPVWTLPVLKWEPASGNLLSPKESRELSALIWAWAGSGRCSGSSGCSISLWPLTSQPLPLFSFLLWLVALASGKFLSLSSPDLPTVPPPADWLVLVPGSFSASGHRSLARVN